MGKTVNKDISKNLSGKYSQQNFDLAKQFAADTLNTTLKKDLIKMSYNSSQNNSQIEESIEIP